MDASIRRAQWSSYSFSRHHTYSKYLCSTENWVLRNRWSSFLCSTLADSFCFQYHDSGSFKQFILCASWDAYFRVKHLALCHIHCKIANQSYSKWFIDVCCVLDYFRMGGSFRYRLLCCFKIRHWGLFVFCVDKCRLKYFFDWHCKFDWQWRTTCRLKNSSSQPYWQWWTFWQCFTDTVCTTFS